MYTPKTLGYFPDYVYSLEVPGCLPEYDRGQVWYPDTSEYIHTLLSTLLEYFGFVFLSTVVVPLDSADLCQPELPAL